MILLRRLRVTAFKHLRNIELWFPRRGSILIEGHNESGKSTLFEAIYFALYGRALVGEHQGQPSLEALLPHGEERAQVYLAIQIGATELEVTRTLTRTRGASKVDHRAKLGILRPGAPAETISAVNAVNDRILQEMNGLDSAILRNSCLMEQQALDRIETLPRIEREKAISRLLGIEAIQRIKEELRVKKQDEEQLEQAAERLEIAHRRQEARQADEAAQRATRELRAAKAHAALLARDSLTSELQTEQVEREKVAGELSRMRERANSAAALEEARAKGEESARLLREAEQQENALAVLRARQGHSASAGDIATDRSRQLAQIADEIAAAEAGEREQRTHVATTQRRARSTGLFAGIAGVAAAIVGAAAALTHLLWLLPLALVLAVAAFIGLIRWRRCRGNVRNGQGKFAALTTEIVQLRANFAAMQRLSVPAGEFEYVTPSEIAAHEQQAQAAHNASEEGLRAFGYALTSSGVSLSDASLGNASLVEMQQAHEAMVQTLRGEMTRLDVQGTQRQQGGLEAREQHLRLRCAELAAHCDEQRQQLTALLAEEGIAASADDSSDALVARWPALAAGGDCAALAEELARYNGIAQKLRQQVDDMCQRNGFDAETLDVAVCQIARDELEQGLRQRRLAAEMAGDVFARIVQRVLPETEAHMRALLPELTDGRYRDVWLRSDDESSADLRIQLWDEQAGRFVGKQLFSGGTRDQASLALRLAFALATLPKELGAMPGFIFLDEPLSSFDDRRSQALVDVLTRGTIGRQFPQVFLISHSQSFDPAAFTCALRMSRGQVASSTLPDEQAAGAQWQQD
jgi:DNA repair exonuclease SbcCD ATPase subunit